MIFVMILFLNRFCFEFVSELIFVGRWQLQVAEGVVEAAAASWRLCEEIPKKEFKKRKKKRINN